MFVPSMVKAVLETAADLIEKLAPDVRGPLIVGEEDGVNVGLGPLIATALRSLAGAAYNADRDKLLATLRALRDQGVKPIDQGELDQQVRDVSEAAARRP